MAEVVTDILAALSTALGAALLVFLSAALGAPVHALRQALLMVSSTVCAMATPCGLRSQVIRLVHAPQARLVVKTERKHRELERFAFNFKTFCQIELLDCFRQGFNEIFKVGCTVELIPADILLNVQNVCWILLGNYQLLLLCLKATVDT